MKKKANGKYKEVQKERKREERQNERYEKKGERLACQRIPIFSPCSSHNYECAEINKKISINFRYLNAISVIPQRLPFRLEELAQPRRIHSDLNILAAVGHHRDTSRVSCKTPPLYFICLKVTCIHFHTYLRVNSILDWRFESSNR